MKELIIDLNDDVIAILEQFIFVLAEMGVKLVMESKNDHVVCRFSKMEIV